MKNNFRLLGVIGAAILMIAFAGTAMADATIVPMNESTILKTSSQNTEVTALQQFLRTNTDIYPTGLVTGYFGPLSDH